MINRFIVLLTLCSLMNSNASYCSSPKKAEDSNEAIVPKHKFLRTLIAAMNKKPQPKVGKISRCEELNMRNQKVISYSKQTSHSEIVATCIGGTFYYSNENLSDGMMLTLPNGKEKYFEFAGIWQVQNSSINKQQ